MGKGNAPDVKFPVFFAALTAAWVLSGCGFFGGGGEIADTETPAERRPAAVPENGAKVETFSVRSDVMDRDIRAGVVLPPGYGETETVYPVLYALHGAHAPWDCWSRMKPLNDALREKPAVIVFFDGDAASYYVDSQKDAKSQFTNFFFRELMPYIRRNYRVGDSRHLCGFSMGGYGAMHYMLCRPEYFRSVFVFSSGLHYMDKVNGLAPAKRGTMHFGPYEGNEKSYAPYSIYGRLEDCLARGVPLPAVKLVWGSEDQVAETDEMARYFAEYWSKRGLKFEYERLPGGHNWKFWKENSPKVLDFVWRNR